MLLAGVLLVGILPLGVLFVTEKEMVSVVSGLLEKREKILLGSEMLGEEMALLISGASLVVWYF